MWHVVQFQIPFHTILEQKDKPNQRKDQEKSCQHKRVDSPRNMKNIGIRFVASTKISLFSQVNLFQFLHLKTIKIPIVSKICLGEKTGTQTVTITAIMFSTSLITVGSNSTTNTKERKKSLKNFFLEVLLKIKNKN